MCFILNLQQVYISDIVCILRNKLKLGFGEILILIILSGVALFLLEIFDVTQTFAFLMIGVGLWSVIFGIAIARSDERQYYVGWGVVVAVFASVFFVPLQYALALVLIAMVLIATISIVLRNKSTVNLSSKPKS